MEEKDLFEEMLPDYLPEERKKGDIIEGVITRKEIEFGYLDLNSKKEGRILVKEIENFNVGDKIEVQILREDENNIIVSKFLLDKKREFLSYNENDIVTGQVVKKIKGGYRVKIGKNEAFLPFSLSRFEKNKDYIGKKFNFLIKEKTKNNIMVSRSDLIKIEEENYFEKVNVGDVVTGKIKQVLDYGIIIDLGATNGFIHISEISWNPVNDLVKKFGINDEISAKIIEKDTEKNKLRLSIKQLSQNPWEVFENNYKIGDVVDVKVIQILDFGIIGEILRSSISGFVHFSELSWNESPKELKNYKVGDNFKAKILEIEVSNRNVKLSVKELSENPWEKVKEKYKVGDILERPILEIFDFGLIVEIEKDVDGLLHISDLDYRKVSNLSSKYKVGDIIKSKIIGFNDEKNRVSLSIKAIFDEKWENIENNYDFDSVLKGKVVNVQDYGIFAQIEEGIEVFIHRNEFSWDRKANISYKLGDEVEFKIIVVDKIEKKLSGSIKQLTKSPWTEVKEQFKKGNIVNTQIEEITENFVLVKLTDRFNGIILKRELAKDFLKNISDNFAIGDKVSAIITDINDKKKSVVLSIKKVLEMEEKKEMDELMKIYGV